MKGKSIYFLGCLCMVMIFLINSVASKGLAAEEFLPVVLYSVPGDMDTDVPISGVLRITFLLPMDPVTTLPSFHLYVAGDLETDLKGNGSLDLNGNILTFVFSGLDYGEYYEVIIDSSATDLEGNSLDGNYDQENGQGDLDNWWMRFETVEEPIQPPPPVAGYTSIFRSGEMISSLAVDSEDYLWAGTQAEGNDEGEIWYFTGRTWVKKTPSLNSQLSINNITCMLPAQDQMWVVFDISGESDPNLPKVGVFKNDNWQIISAEELNISHEEIINDIAIDSLGQVWLATGASGVLKYRIERKNE